MPIRDEFNHHDAGGWPRLQKAAIYLMSHALQTGYSKNVDHYYLTLFL